MGDLLQVLKDAAMNPNPQVRQEAAQKLEDAQRDQYASFLAALCGEFAMEDKSPDGRQLAGIYLKNMISARDEETQQAKRNQWFACDAATREGARQAFLQSLVSPVALVAHTSAQTLAAYGVADVPRGEFSTLLPTLKQYVENDQVPEVTKIACLECMGYFCDALDPEEKIGKESTDQILTAIVNGMQESRSIQMRTAATQALQNTLIFASANFEAESGAERDAIMQSIRSAMTCKEDEKVRELAYQCLVMVADNYYEYIAPYIQGIYDLSIQAIRTDEETVASQAIEFWTAVACAEIDISEDLDEGVPADEVTHHYIMKAIATQLTPVVLEVFTKVEDDDGEDDEVPIQMAGHIFLENLALCIEDAVVPIVVPYVQQHINSPDWKFRDAAVSAFGFILSGPMSATLFPIVSQAAPAIVNLTQDANEHVAYSSLWTLAKICEFHKEAIPAECLNNLIQAVLTSLDRNSSRVQGKACLAVHNLALACEEAADLPTNLLSSFFKQVITKILAVATTYSRDDSKNENLLNAYEAINMLVANSAKDQLAVVQETLLEALTRLEASNGPSTGLTGQQKQALHGYLASLLGQCIQKIEGTDIPDALADRIMNALLSVVSDNNSIALQDGYMTLGFMIDSMENRYMRYAETVMPYLFNALDKQDDYATCFTAVGVFGDICRAIGDKIAPWCDKLMEKLFGLLQSATVQKVVKPHVISLFSDVAMAIGPHFERYATVVMGILGKAVDSAKLRNDGDEDHEEFVFSIREAIMEAYTGIIIGLKDANKADLLGPSVEKIFTFVVECTNQDDEDRRPLALYKSAVGVIGDLADAFGAKIYGPLNHPSIQTLLRTALTDESVAETAKWAMLKVSQIRQ